MRVIGQGAYSGMVGFLVLSGVQWCFPLGRWCMLRVLVTLVEAALG